MNNPRRKLPAGSCASAVRTVTNYCIEVSVVRLHIIFGRVSLS